MILDSFLPAEIKTSGFMTCKKKLDPPYMPAFQFMKDVDKNLNDMGIFIPEIINDTP